MKKEFATFSGTVPALYDQYIAPLFFTPVHLVMKKSITVFQSNELISSYIYY